MNLRIQGATALVLLLVVAPCPARSAGAEALPVVSGVFGLDRVEQSAAIAFWTPLEPGQVLTGFSWFNNDGSVAFPQVKALAAECDRPDLLENATVVGGVVQGNDGAWSRYEFETPLASTEAGLYVILSLPAGSICTGEGRGGGAGVGYTAGDGRRQCWFTVGNEPWEALSGEYMMAVTCEKSADKTAGKAADFLLVGRGGLASGTESTAENQDIAPAPALAGTFRAYPNPFNPEVEIVFGLANDDEVSASVYDIRGRLVRSLASARLAAGEHRWTWDGRDDAGRKAPSGLYLARVVAGATSSAIRITLVQ